MRCCRGALGYINSLLLVLLLNDKLCLVSVYLSFKFMDSRATDLCLIIRIKQLKRDLTHTTTKKTKEGSAKILFHESPNHVIPGNL